MLSLELARWFSMSWQRLLGPLPQSPSRQPGSNSYKPAVAAGTHRLVKILAA